MAAMWTQWAALAERAVKALERIAAAVETFEREQQEASSGR
jgi:hypothetical protein